MTPSITTTSLKPTALALLLGILPLQASPQDVQPPREGGSVPREESTRDRQGPSRRDLLREHSKLIEKLADLHSRRMTEERQDAAAELCDRILDIERRLNLRIPGHGPMNPPPPGSGPWMRPGPGMDGPRGPGMPPGPGGPQMQGPQPGQPVSGMAPSQPRSFSPGPNPGLEQVHRELEELRNHLHRIQSELDRMNHSRNQNGRQPEGEPPARP